LPVDQQISEKLCTASGRDKRFWRGVEAARSTLSRSRNYDSLPKNIVDRDAANEKLTFSELRAGNLDLAARRCVAHKLQPSSKFELPTDTRPLA
jgi:hypothetical protein